MATFFRRYSQSLERFPLLTKSLTSGVIGSLLSLSLLSLCPLPLHPLLSQEVVGISLHKNYQMNHSTIKDSQHCNDHPPPSPIPLPLLHLPCCSVFLQTTLVGPTLHLWYGTLFKMIPGAGVVNTLKRVTLDQGIFAPIFITTFMSSNLLLTGKSIDQVCPSHSLPSSETRTNHSFSFNRLLRN